MKKNMVCISAVALMSVSAMADISVSTYDDLTEGFQTNDFNPSFHYNGVTYFDRNNVDGVQTDGVRFVGGGAGFDSLGDTVMVENATFFYDEFPTFGSRSNGLTFGRSFVPGDNLSISRLSTVSMALDTNADFASIEIGFMENGVWGGDVMHFEATLRGVVVDSVELVISNLGGRDNAAITTLSVGGGEFDTLRLFATLGDEFTAMPMILDNLTVNTVPAPGTLALLMGTAGFMNRRRR